MFLRASVGASNTPSALAGWRAQRERPRHGARPVVYVAQMAVVGVTVRIREGRARLKVVVLGDPTSESAARKFEHRCPSGQHPDEQVRSIAEALYAQLVATTADIGALIVLEADESPRGGLTPGRKLRARSEGALMQVGGAFAPQVRVLNKVEATGAAGRNLHPGMKAAAEEVSTEFMDACTAALAAATLA